MQQNAGMGFRGETKDPGAPTRSPGMARYAVVSTHRMPVKIVLCIAAQPIPVCGQKPPRYTWILCFARYFVYHQPARNTGSKLGYCTSSAFFASSRHSQRALDPSRDRGHKKKRSLDFWPRRKMFFTHHCWTARGWGSLGIPQAYSLKQVCIPVIGHIRCDMAVLQRSSRVAGTKIKPGCTQHCFASRRCTPRDATCTNHGSWLTGYGVRLRGWIQEEPNRNR